MKKLIVFYSLDGNTKFISENIILGNIDFKDPLKHDKENDAKKAREWASKLINN